MADALGAKLAYVFYLCFSTLAFSFFFCAGRQQQPALADMSSLMSANALTVLIFDSPVQYSTS
jgi:hypothetical protein